jgi:hypothetical protein
VARDLCKLPPVTYEHIDVSVFLTEMREMRRDIAELKRDKQQVSFVHSDLWVMSRARFHCATELHTAD